MPWKRHAKETRYTRSCFCESVYMKNMDWERGGKVDAGDWGQKSGDGVIPWT